MSENMNSRGFGTFTGIFVPSVTMMFGVILFLRLGLVVGNVGIIQFALIIALSLFIMATTSLSIAMVVTNMEVGGGGAYYLISRSLGIEIGGAIGLALVVAQLVSLALCITGFAYSITSIYPHIGHVEVEIATLFLLAIASIYSANLALKVQTAIFAILMVTIAAIYFGMEPGDPVSSSPYFEQPLGFWAAFAIFYPALTGIEAGMALSGALKNPSRSLSIGTISSILFAALTYLLIALFLWYNFSLEELSSDPFILLNHTAFPSIFYLGIWSATLSSALGNLVGAPRMVQMIAEDSALPKFLSATFGKYKEPRYANILIVAAAALLIFFTTIDQILPILTMICLLTYGTINLVAGLSELIHSASWRPTFRSPWQLSIAAAVTCYLTMFTIDPIFAIIAIAGVALLYLFYSKRDIEVTFHDFRNSIILYISRKALYHLSGSEEHPINWMPKLLVVSRAPTAREQMIYLSEALAYRSGILTIVTILPEIWEETEQLEKKHQVLKEWLAEKSIKCIAEVVSYANYYRGIVQLIKSHGLGSLQPNTLMLTYSENESDDVGELLPIFETAQAYGRNILLYFEGKDLSLEELTRKPIEKKRIDVWWDPNEKTNFELIVGFVLALRTSPIWRHRALYLHTTARDKSAKRHLEGYFSTFFKKMRVRFKIVVHLEESLSLADSLKKHSTGADLIFFPLRLISDCESREEFESYLKEVTSTLPGEIPTFAVSCYDSVDHREIYRPFYVDPNSA